MGENASNLQSIRVLRTLMAVENTVGNYKSTGNSIFFYSHKVLYALKNRIYAFSIV